MYEGINEASNFRHIISMLLSNLPLPAVVVAANPFQSQQQCVYRKSRAIISYEDAVYGRNNITQCLKAYLRLQHPSIRQATENVSLVSPHTS